MARTPVRMWIAAGAASCALLALVGWVFVVAPAQEKAAEAWSETTTTEEQSAALRAQNAALEVQYQTVDAERSRLAEMQESLPQSDGLEELLRAVAQSGVASGVTVDEITAGDPIDLSLASTASVPSTDAAESTDADAGATIAPAVTEAATPTLFVLPITLRASGKVADLEEFLLLVQSGQPRAILLTSVTMVPNAGGTSFDQTVMMTAETRVFVAPPRSAGADAEPVE